ncbi:glycosyl transferase family 2 [Aeromonas jandaei]|uniref:glycosyltransferase family 2 protein n=1 Tax=Aeromonas jandaei TaxID=650 RepID=UPI00194F2E72|nr:glycosyltransferase family 2 protein [Aeromonas jandaei]BCS48552.1 glycosyl transferase family 2 [Aeromonas jandaei]
MNEKNKIKVITVAVITYNSATTVYETLNSIINQTYGPENIELIISDDCSTDTTVQLIEEWLVKNSGCFKSVSFFANTKNVGISKNCNVAWKAATSEWIKTIAGDDILLPSCLTDNNEYVLALKEDNVAVLFSKIQSFKVKGDGSKENLNLLPTPKTQRFFNMSPLEQFEYLQRQEFSCTPSSFINRVKLESISFADERFSMIEDFPLWFKFTQSGFQLRFFDKVTVLYRVGNSISHSTSCLVNTRFIDEIMAVERLLVLPTLKSHQKLLKLRKSWWPVLVIKLAGVLNNKNNIFNKLLLSIVFMIKPGYLSAQLHKILK